MRITDIILKKRDGGTLTKEEIEFFINGYSSDEIPDYQIASLLMAIWFNGMDKRETTELTLAMAASGDQIDLSPIPGVKVDKHSTGGVGDTTTLVAAPLVAACGGKVAKMSGRGLGHSGGTLDKLESITGFQIGQEMDTFLRIVSDIGLSIIGQTANLVPADKKLYALRDVTGTIDNLSLIASSVMSKKIAAGSNAIVLDVKTGNGAFMQKVEEARELARIMVDIGNLAGRKTIALVTDMNQPLGNAVGNALEVQEAIEILQGTIRGGDLSRVCSGLSSWMLVVSGLAETVEEGEFKVKEALQSGRALDKLGRMIEAQGGDKRVIEDVSLLPQAKKRISLEAGQDGWLHTIETAEVGYASMLLGAGRVKKSDIIDPAVGLWLKKRRGDQVRRGDLLAEFYVNDDKNLEEAVSKLSNAIQIKTEKPELPPLIHEVIE